MSRQRDPWFDNARWLAGSLVVLVHASSGMLASGNVIEWMHAALSPARLPLFVLLVGFFTPVEPTKRDRANLIQMVVVPYIILTACHALFLYLTGVDAFYNPLRAAYTLWFLPGVIFWRLVIPVLMRLRYPLLVAVMISLFSGAFAENWVFDMNKVLGMLPYVIIGVMLRENHDRLRYRSRFKTKLSLVAPFLWISIITMFSLAGNLNIRMVGMVDPYPWEGTLGVLGGMVLRLLQLGLVTACALSVLYWMPRRDLGWITYIGSGGFTIYLLHGLILQILRHFGFLGSAPATSANVVAVILFSFALAALLGSSPVRRLARGITKPNVQWLLLQETQPAHPRSLVFSRAGMEKRFEALEGWLVERAGLQGASARVKGDRVGRGPKLKFSKRADERRTDASRSDRR